MALNGRPGAQGRKGGSGDGIGVMSLCVSRSAKGGPEGKRWIRGEEQLTLERIL